MNALKQKSAIRKTILSDGLVILSENLPSYTSISFGVWVKAGSRDELPSEKGMAHFLEHMIFQGTQRRTSFEIANTLEQVGGSINAFTAKEETCFYAHCLPQHLELVSDLMADMVCNPTLADEGIAKEKTVIREEINSVYDTPDDYILDILQEKTFPQHAMGYPILGDKKSIYTFDHKKLYSFWQKHYRPGNIVVSVAGDVDHEILVALVEKYFKFSGTPVAPRADTNKTLLPAAHGEYKMNVDVSQAHYALGFRTPGFNSDERLALLAINHYLGEGMTARLFRVLREEYAYVYSIYSFIDFFKDSGLFGVYLGTDFKNMKLAAKLAMDEITALSNVILAEDVVGRLKQQLQGSLLLSLESTFKHMARLFKSDLYFGKVRPLYQVVAEIEKLSAQLLKETAGKFLVDERAVSILFSPEGKE